MAPTSPASATTWVDITDISEWHGPPTGIQRVVHEFGSRVLKAQGNVKCCRFDAGVGAFIPATNDALSDPFDSRSPTLPPSDPAVSPAHESRSQFTRQFTRRFGRRFGADRDAPIATAAFAPGDRLVIIGANWLTPGYAQHLQTLAADSGLEITQVMYDLIPSMYPQWAATGAAAIVTPFLVRVLPLCKNIICISNNTKHDVEQFVAAHGLELRSDVNLQVIRLGAAPSASASASPLAIGSAIRNEEVSIPPPSVSPTEPFILCVGTLEVRKNQFVLYQTYREAIRVGIALPKLYCVGRIGWLAEATEHAIRHDPAVNSSIEILESVSDAQLTWLYEHCMFTVYPSLYEGWGLPVGESLSHAKICITTRQASLPEVGGDLADYASPFSSAAWLEAIVMYLNPTVRSAREATIRAGFQHRTWDVAGVEFCDALRIV